MFIKHTKNENNEKNKLRFLLSLLTHLLSLAYLHPTVVCWCTQVTPRDKKCMVHYPNEQSLVGLLDLHHKTFSLFKHFLSMSRLI